MHEIEYISHTEYTPPSLLPLSPPPLKNNHRRFKQEIGGYTQALAEQGFLLTHWEVVRDLWMDSLRSSPYMEAYELQNMELGTESALYRFFTQHVVTPAVAAINAMDKVYEDSSNAELVSSRGWWW